MRLHAGYLFAVASCVVATPTPQSASDINATPDLGYNELYSLQQQFYDKFMYPNNLEEAHKINSTIFSENVQGRVSDTRNFVGRELNTEYIFGLFTGAAAGTSIIGTPSTYEVVQFVANQNIAAASTRVQFNFASFGNITLPVMIDTWLTWNSDRQITQYDVIFRWFANLLSTLLSTVDPDPAVAAAKASAGMVKSICDTHETYCNGTNIQYADRDQCTSFLTQDVRMGQSFELGMNTLLCRNVHEIMVQYRPEVHCPHIGKTGGGMCDDTTSYTERVSEKYYNNSPWIPTQAQ